MSETPSPHPLRYALHDADSPSVQSSALLLLQTPDASELAESLVRVLQNEFTPSQRALFLELGDLQGLTASKAAQEASRRLNVDRSTVRKNLQAFRRLGWLTYGDRQSKGKPLALTRTGLFLFNHLRLSHAAKVPLDGEASRGGRRP